MHVWTDISIPEMEVAFRQRVRDFTAAVMTLWLETAVNSLSYKEKH